MVNTEKRRLLFVVHGYNNKAGVEEHVKLLVSYLRSNYEISVCFPENNSIVLMQDGRGLIRYPGDQIDLIAPYHSEKSEWAFSQILKRVQPDVIHFEHFLNWPLAIIEQACASGIPVVVSFHDYYAITPIFRMQGAHDARETTSLDYSMRNFGADLTSYLKTRQHSLISSLQYAKALVVPSEYLAQQLEQIFPYKFKVIENGIRPFSVLDESRAWDGVRFGYVGTMDSEKGWEMLLDAFSEVRRSYPDTQLHFYGGVGDSVKEHSGIIFHGAYKRSELPKILSNINIGVIPSLFPETYSLVLSELWQGRIAPIVSDIGAMSARVQDGVNGKKFKAGDKDSLVTAMRWFLEHDEWRSWSLPTPRHVEAMGAEYDELYCNIMKPRNVETSFQMVENG